jgi:hypothetical protein
MKHARGKLHTEVIALGLGAVGLDFFDGGFGGFEAFQFQICKRNTLSTLTPSFI